MRLQDPRDLPRVPGHLKRHPVLWAKAPGEQLDLLRLGLDPASRTNLAILHDRDLAEIPVHIQPHRSHRSLLALGSKEREAPWANDTDGFALEAQPDKSQGRPMKSPGSNSTHRPTTGLPNMRSP